MDVRRIFLSATARGLAQYREAAYGTIEGLEETKINDMAFTYF